MNNLFFVIHLFCKNNLQTINYTQNKSYVGTVGLDTSSSGDTQAHTVWDTCPVLQRLPNFARYHISLESLIG
jgi:hypothetical protein